MPRSTVIPELPYRDVGAAVSWLCVAFGFSVRLRIANHRAQLNVGDGAVVVTERSGRENAHEGASSVMVRVDDVDGLFARALRGGARVLQAPTAFPYGERQCVVADCGGHRWCFSQTIVDTDPAEWGGIPGEL